MTDWSNIVPRAQDGDRAAFEEIVRQSQDMALGYAFSFLRDFDLAQDVAQESFLQAYRDLCDLRSPEAFPGWFRRIVFKRGGKTKVGEGFNRPVGEDRRSGGGSGKRLVPRNRGGYP